MEKVQAKVWEFPSSSGKKVYQTIQYTDGYLSCNCMGWTRRAIRECKHTNMVNMGTADQHCAACNDLTKTKANPIPVQVTQTEKPKVKKATPKKSRKITDDEIPPTARNVRW